MSLPSPAQLLTTLSADWRPQNPQWISQTISNFSEINYLIRRASTSDKLARLVKILPSAPLQAFIETQLNQLLLPKLVAGELDFMLAQPVLVEIKDLDLQLIIQVTENKVEVARMTSCGDDFAARLSLNLSDAIDLLTQQADPDTLFFRRRLQINGSTELVHQLKNTIDSMDPAKLPEWMLTILRYYQHIHSQIK